MSNQELSNHYEPREQFMDLHTRQVRWACVVAHRRAGKTVACVNELITRALYTQKKNARYGYIAPFYRQAKDVAWQYLKEYAEPFAARIREADLRVELINGSWITLYGSDNPDALRGLYLDGAVLDEYGDSRPSLWGEVVRPTLSDRKGWAIFIGTPKGRNHFYEINKQSKQSERWINVTLRASETGLLDDEEIEDLREQLSEEQYEQEMECSFEAAVLGTYYAAIINMLEKKQQISPEAAEYDPQFPVSVAMDIGYTDSTAMWFWQPRPDGIAVIDYEEAQSQPLEYYFELLLNKAYQYDKIWLPHDARAKTLQTGRSTVEQFLNPEQIDPKFKGISFPVDITPSLKKQHGIDAARLILPKCYINQTTCSEGIEALRAYRRKYNDITKSLSNEPLHDWASDGADAFRYMALVTKDKSFSPAPTPIASEQASKTGYNLNGLFAEREKPRSIYARRRI
jgi:hypothetical protein